MYCTSARNSCLPAVRIARRISSPLRSSATTFWSRGSAVILTSGSGFTGDGRRGRRESRGCTEIEGRHPMTLGELVERLGGKLAQGSADHVIGGVNSTVLAGSGDLVFAQDSASAPDALTSNAGAVVL